MKELAILLRAIRLYSQIAHHSVFGPTFFADHKTLGKFYEEQDESYDQLTERIIGLYGIEHLDLMEIQILAVEKLKTLPTKNISNEAFFTTVGQLETELCHICTQLLKHPAIYAGTQDLIARIADESEARQFLIRMRIK